MTVPKTCQRCGERPVDFKVSFEAGVERDEETGRPHHIYGDEYLCSGCAVLATREADFIGSTFA